VVACSRLFTLKGAKPLKVPLLLSVWQAEQRVLVIVVLPTTGSPPELDVLLEDDELLELDELELLEEDELVVLDEEDVELLELDEAAPLEELDELELVPMPPFVQPCRAKAPAATKTKAIFLISTTLLN
jgi:hypothetical protein